MLLDWDLFFYKFQVYIWTSVVGQNKHGYDTL